MARISRVVVPGYPHHITQQGIRSVTISHRDKDRQSYLQFLSEGLVECLVGRNLSKAGQDGKLTKGVNPVRKDGALTPPFL